MEERDYETTYRLEEANWWFVGTRRVCIEWLRRCRAGSVGHRGRDAGDRVLDVGCGTGINIEALAEVGDVIGLDLSPTALRFCRERGLPDLLQARGEQVPFPDGSFDVVTAIDVLEHIADDQGAVAEWARLLAPGGHVLILTSAYPLLWSGHDVSNHHTRRYRATEVRRLLTDAGLDEVRVSYLNTFLLPPILAVRLLQRLVRRGAVPAAHKDTAEVPGPVNRLLIGLLALEARILRSHDLPAGVSIVASGVRSGTSSD